MKNTEKYIYIILIVILVAVISSGATYMIMKNDNNDVVNKEQTNNDNENNEEISFKEYKALEEIETKDGNKWIVIKDSNKNNDYVTALSMKDYAMEDTMTDEIYDRLLKSLAVSETNKNYDKSVLKDYLENDVLNKINIKLKKVDNYEIRLIKVDEILDLYSDWEYNKEADSYTYKGTDDINDNFIGLFTMSPIKLTGGKSTAFYNTGISQCYNECDKEIFISHWMPGLGGLNPVINVYKSEIK